MRPKVDYSKYVGRKYERLTVLQATRVGGVPYFYCECECGQKKLINAGNVLRGLTKSCGCLLAEVLGKASLDKEIKDKLVRLRASGLSYRKIASRLGISVATASKYCQLLKDEIDRVVEDNLWS